MRMWRKYRFGRHEAAAVCLLAVIVLSWLSFDWWGDPALSLSILVGGLCTLGIALVFASLYAKLEKDIPSN